MTSGVNEMWLEGYEEGKREARADALAKAAPVILAAARLICNERKP